MLHNIKIELFENINIIQKLAKTSSPSLPIEICRFLSREFNFNIVALGEEKNKNKFDIIGKAANSDLSFLDKKLSIENYDELIKSSNYEHDLISECVLKMDKNYPNLISLFICIDEKNNFLLIIDPKSLSTKNEIDNYISIGKFVQVHLKSWLNHSFKNSVISNVNSTDFIDKSTKGLIKDIKTICGLLTLTKEEEIPNSVRAYINEIKSLNSSILDTLNDLSMLNKINESTFTFDNNIIDLKDVISENLAKIEKLNKNIQFDVEDFVSSQFIFDRAILSFLIFNATHLISALSESKKIQLTTSISSDNKLRISISSRSREVEKDKLFALTEPYENKEYTNQQSGLAISLVNKYVELLGGTYKILHNRGNLIFNISLPITYSEPNSLNDFVLTNNIEGKDRILVIESDSASSSLLRNYLSKWNYSTEIVSSGAHALRLLEENKYVAVILNVEQENENSLVLLQKIKNTKATRNIPVIVFSIEAEKDKIYLMGSVEYLVKPINYNNLVEILTSYKLRRNSTVLCVDDDQPTLNLLKQAVQTAGFQVIAEYRPELVLEQIIDKDIDLAIVDLDMPILNGFDLIKKIKSEQKFSKLPIIIYTGKEDYQEDLQKIDGMFVDLLDKNSTSFNELENTIKAMIKSYEEPKNISENLDQTSGPKILMAEDYKHSQIIVTRLLKKSGFENIIVVENGAEALDICETDKMDLILMDMQMPVMNGFEATGKIRELQGYADTPIIALTAFAMKGDREKCIEAGATDYIPKPIDSKEFIEKVKYYTQVSLTT